jgi:beta-glucuronidase
MRPPHVGLNRTLNLILGGAVCLLPLSSVHAAQRVDLDGPGWTFRTMLDDQAQSITVPHSWPTMKTYRNYIGDAIYERDFNAPSIRPGQVVRLHFDGVYYKAHVWLNGHRLGVHEGGYTPFEFEVTGDIIVGQNHLTVEVENTPTLATAGHAGQSPKPYGSAENAGIVGWIPYGGITRPVSLLITEAVYLSGMKIEARPDLTTGTAAIVIHTVLHNAGGAPAVGEVRGTVANLDVRCKPTEIPAGADAEVKWTGSLPHAHLWSVRAPYLYDGALVIPGDELHAKIGVRDIRVQGTQLLLNGRPVHLFGANRVSDDPDEGLRESALIVDRDLSDMLADNMRMMRIAHYPEAPAVLDFADAHGMLIIAEAGNWNMSAWQMADPGIQSLWEQQMREMMQQDWNHPSVIAWSMGNEFESATKQGINWTRQMKQFTLGLDASRPITFASRFTGAPWIKGGDDEASRYCDFVSVNIYGNYAPRLDRVHQLWPEKPVFVTEFGKMGEDTSHDTARIADITNAVSAMKDRPWVIGGSLWTWADYRSLYRGTPADGIRKWGVVDYYRRHRDSWSVVQKLFETELP